MSCHQGSKERRHEENPCFSPFAPSCRRVFVVFGLATLVVRQCQIPSKYIQQLQILSGDKPPSRPPPALADVLQGGRSPLDCKSVGQMVISLPRTRARRVSGGGGAIRTKRGHRGRALFLGMRCSRLHLFVREGVTTKVVTQKPLRTLRHKGTKGNLYIFSSCS